MDKAFNTTVASRLPKSQEERLTRFVLSKNLTKSEFIRDLIIDFLDKKKNEKVHKYKTERKKRMKRIQNSPDEEREKINISSKVISF